MTAGISGLHKMAAMVLNSPGVALSEMEARALAEASANVARYYSPMTMSGKNAAWAALATTMAMIYGPRAVELIRTRRTARGPRMEMSNG